MTLYYSGSVNGFYDSRIHKEMPADVVEISEALHSRLMADQTTGKSIGPDKKGLPVAVYRTATDDQKKSMLQSKVQQHLNAKANSLGYDNMASAVSYAEEPAVTAFQAEGQALRAWRSLVWEAALPLIEADPDQSVDTLIAAIPKFGA
jgi:hypothetical protein